MLSATATVPSVLLLNDKYDPLWTVTVDGKPAPLLHCNYLMRGVQVPAGAHTVEFKMEDRNNLNSLTLIMYAVGAVLGLMLLVFTMRQPKTTVPKPAA